MITIRTFGRLAASVLVLVGALMLGYVGLVFADALQYQAEYHASLPAVAIPVTTRAEMPTPLIDGQAIGEIHIARLGLSEVIGQGDSATVLRRGVGHLADTAWLGEKGNVVLAGHRDTVFRSLREIQLGDRIDVRAANRVVHYEVQSTIVVSPETLSVLAASDGNTLTLITCFPFGFIGAAPERFVVRAREIR
jgi:sortase A